MEEAWLEPPQLPVALPSVRKLESKFNTPRAFVTPSKIGNVHRLKSSRDAQRRVHDLYEEVFHRSTRASTKDSYSNARLKRFFFPAIKKDRRTIATYRSRKKSQEKR